MGKYDDIIHLEHHVSKNHKQMSIYERSAQFAPFAALVGYDESIENASVLYEQRITITSDKQDEITKVLSLLTDRKNSNQIVKVTFFKPVVDRNLGKYCECVSTFKKVDNIKRLLILEKDNIHLNDIIDIELCSDI